MERRESYRISLSGRVDIKEGESQDFHSTQAINISKGGMALYADCAFEINTELLLTIYYKNETGEKNEDVTGIVRWIKPVGKIFAIGIQFKELGRETHPLIFSYMELNKSVTPP